MALSPVTPADTAEVAPAPTDRACDTVSKFVLALTQWDAWINFAVNDDGTATQGYLDWIGTGTGTTAGQLNAPTGVSATTTRTTDVTVTWNPVSGAVYYNVYRGTSADTSSMKLLAGNQTGSSYVNLVGPTTVVGTNYWYAVRAYSGTQISAMSTAVTGVVALDTSGGGTPAPFDRNFEGEGLYSYVIPAGFHFMEVHAFGAGGYGADRDGPEYDPVQAPGAAIGDGGGGGSGSYNHVTRIPVSPDDVFTVRVGKSVAGGTGETRVLKGSTEASATYVSAPGGGPGVKGRGYTVGAGGPAGALGSNTFGGGSVNEADREAGHAGQSGRSSYGTAATGGAALTKSGMTAGGGGVGSYIAHTPSDNMKGTDGYVRLTLTAT